MHKKHFYTRPAALALSVAMLGSALPASAASASDLEGHWAAQTITKWLDAGKIRGYEDGTFRPDRNVSRAEFATILSGLLPDGAGTENEGHRFADVQEGQWYYEPVMRMLHFGVAAPGEKFLPDEPITRQDMMAMTSRAFGVWSDDETVLEKFVDAGDIADYARSAVAGFAENGYMAGYPDKTIRPKAAISRAESVQLLEGLGMVHAVDSLEGILERVYAGVQQQLPRVQTDRVNEDNVNYYLGLADMSEIAEAAASEPMMSAIPHSVCLVRAKEGVDANALAEKIRTSVNPNKWICVGVEPEQVVTAVQGDLILLAMNPQYSREIADSFLALDLAPKLSAGADGLIQTDGYYMDDMGALRPEAVSRFAEKVEYLAANQLSVADRLYYAIVPSKAYYVNDRLQTPFDYDAMFRTLRAGIRNVQEVDLTGALSLADYCRTDPHWRQDKLQGVLDQLGSAMGFQTDLTQYTAHTVADFTGQHGYKKPDFAKETLTYLTSEAIDKASVDNWENKEFKQVYQTAAFTTDTPYDLFLSGASPLITITNADAKSGRELVILRDSFASSLAPLLIDSYKTITLVDLRYMPDTLLKEYVDFSGKDVLLMFNDQVVNHSEMLRVTMS